MSIDLTHPERITFNLPTVNIMINIIDLKYEHVRSMGGDNNHVYTNESLNLIMALNVLDNTVKINLGMGIINIKLTSIQFLDLKIYLDSKKIILPY